MANDFKANQIRTSQVIASGTNGSNAAILLYGSQSATNTSGGYPAALIAGVGSDVFLFVSGAIGSKGSIGSKGMTVLGGDTQISGSVFVSGPSLFGGNVIITGSLGATKITGSLQQTDNGLSYLVAGDAISIVSGTNGQIRISASGLSPAGSNGYVQFYDSGVFLGNEGLVYNKTTQTLSVGNLYVTGAITAVTSSNLVISDPVLYIASGSQVSNTNGGIAIASGSSVQNQSLVIGRVANDTWGVGRLDVSAGALTDLTSMNLVNFRAGKVELGGTVAVVSSSSGNALVLSGAMVQVTGSINGNGNAVFAGNISGSNALLTGDLAVNGGDITSTASTLTIGGSSNTYVAVGADLRLDTNIIKASGNATAITLTSSNVAVAGSLTVNGFNIIGNASSLAVGDTPPTVTLGAAATTLSVGAGSSASDSTFNIASARTGNLTFNIASGGTTAGKTKVINIGSGGTAGITEIRIGTSGSTASTHVTGALYVSSSQGTAATFYTGISGSLTRLSNGTSYLVAGSNVTIASGSNGQVTISSTGGSGTPGGSDTQVQFNQGGTTFGGDTGLTYDYNNSRLYSDNLTVTSDALFQGAVDVNYGIATTQSTFSLVDTTATTVTFAKAATSLDMGISTGITVISGSVRAPNGISGSLTQLTDGRSYLVAGSNVTITSASNGQVTIASTGGSGGGSSYFTDPSAGRINATGSLALAGGLGSSYVSTNAGTDVQFFVSGNVGTTSAKSSRVSLFGGDIVSSGSLFIEDSTSYAHINQSSGNLTIRNRALSGQFVASVNTSIGNTVNFLDVRPNGMAVNTKVAIMPSIFAGPANPFNSTDTSMFIGGSAGSKDGAAGGTTVIGGDLVISGSTYVGNSSSNSVFFNARLASDILPDGNRTRNLGSDNLRFANIFTGDLHLRNERGDYTLIEEEDCLTIRFNKNGKRYRFLLEPAPEFDEER